MCSKLSAPSANHWLPCNGDTWAINPYAIASVHQKGGSSRTRCCRNTIAVWMKLCCPPSAPLRAPGLRQGRAGGGGAGARARGGRGWRAGAAGRGAGSEGGAWGGEARGGGGAGAEAGGGAGAPWARRWRWQQQWPGWLIYNHMGSAEIITAAPGRATARLGYLTAAGHP